MSKLNGYHRKYLRGIAHALKPVVLIGQKGLTAEVLRSTETALDYHELIKVKFIEFKEKDRKAEILERLEMETGCEMVGIIGHTAILYRQQKNPEKRKISLPKKKKV